MGLNLEAGHSCKKLFWINKFGLNLETDIKIGLNLEYGY